MRLKLEDAVCILQNEISWCRDHPDPKLTQDQQTGFMNGLRQAQNLLCLAEKELDERLRVREFLRCEHGYVLNLCPICFPDKSRAAHAESDKPMEVSHAHD